MLVQACFEELRIAYDEAFERLRSEVRLMNSSQLEGNARRVEQAELEYRQSRDELANFILDRHPKAAAAGRGCR
jgi:hypothetical protein